MARFQKISFVIIGILVVSCGALATFVSVLGDRAGQSIAIRGVSAAAEAQTSGVASQLLGPLRFKKMDDIDNVLAAATEQTDLVVGFLVQAQDGSAVVWPDSGLSDVDRASLEQLALLTSEAAAPNQAREGLLQAFPIRKSPDDAPIGVVAALWTAEPFMADIAQARRMQIKRAVLGLAVLTFLGWFAVRIWVASPLEALCARAEQMSDGDLHTDVPATGLRSEVGSLARSFEALRQNLETAKEAADGAFYDAAGFQASSAALVMCDRDLAITQWNRAGKAMLRSIEPALKLELASKQHLDALRIDALNTRMLEEPDFPISTDFQRNNKVFGYSVQAIEKNGERQGYVLEFQDITEGQTTSGILSALEVSALRGDFDANGQLVSMNPNLARLLGDAALGTSASTAITGVSGEEIWPNILKGNAYTGKFVLSFDDKNALLDGSINPIKDSTGQKYAFVLLGADVTQSELELSRAKQDTDSMLAAQEAVVAELSNALAALKQGSLTTRIEAEFDGKYGELRRDFNDAASSLHNAMADVIGASSAIRGDAEEVNSATQDLSKRTESQAATLEQTSAALVELTASVQSATEGASRAAETAKEASKNAKSSGKVVRDAVAAMHEIESSSDAISKIIGVIDDIAFQTNLLALNAGVEAARAGDAGRGFAVVASEVRSLAQRASEAAREITQLINSSGEQVKRWANLVQKAGDALSEIVSSVQDISENVGTIASSSKEQSVGISEINDAVAALDRATHHNTAMVEKTTTTTHNLSDQAEKLWQTTEQFKTGHPAIAVSERDSQEVPPAFTPRAVAPNGNLAEDTESWNDF
ncbi:MAG: methyl-accepting chemotaxis protein [Pseudomonadota bacterium]